MIKVSLALVVGPTMLAYCKFLAHTLPSNLGYFLQNWKSDNERRVTMAFSVKISKDFLIKIGPFTSRTVMDTGFHYSLVKSIWVMIVTSS